MVRLRSLRAAATLAVGLAQGTPDSALVLVVYDRLSRPVAKTAARGLARWHRSQGRNIVLPDP